MLLLWCQPQWMTARHWRGRFLWADTADLNIKTWCKTVIKSQLQLASMKSQLSVSGAANRLFNQGDDRGSRQQTGNRGIQKEWKEKKGEKWKVGGWEQTQLSRGGRVQEPTWMQRRTLNIQTSSAVETGFLPFPSLCSHSWIMNNLLKGSVQLRVKSTGSTSRDVSDRKLKKKNKDTLPSYSNDSIIKSWSLPLG